MRNAKIKVGISSCLLGEKVRYDGTDKHDHFLMETLGRKFECLGICPEVECGLGVPRETMHLEGNPENPRLVTDYTKVDHTDRILKWTRNKLVELENEGLGGFIFKRNSPSCDADTGIFASQFIRRFALIPVESEDRLHDPETIKRFIENVFEYERKKRK